MGDLENLDKLVYLMFKLIDSETGNPNTKELNWKNDAQVISIKIFKHVSSMRQIYVGTNFEYSPEESFSYVDISSIAVLLRSAYETYFAFHYVFMHPDPIVVDYRYKTWRLAGLMSRGKMATKDIKAKIQLAAEDVIITDLAEEIRSHTHHATLSEKRQKVILEGRWEPFEGMNALSAEAGIHPTYFKDVYRGLSTHAHASYISALQIRDTHTIPEQEKFAKGYIDNGVLILAHLIHSYVKLFPKSKSILDSSPTSEIATGWYVRTEDVAHIYN